MAIIGKSFSHVEMLEFWVYLIMLALTNGIRQMVMVLRHLQAYLRVQMSLNIASESSIQITEMSDCEATADKSGNYADLLLTTYLLPIMPMWHR